jgi:hypothetical protein
MSRYIIYKNEKYGFIDETGAEIIKPQFDLVSDFSEGLARAIVTRNDTWVSGFINETGNWEIEPTFSGYGFSATDIRSSSFSNGLTPIRSGNKKMMYINKAGEAVTDAIFDKAYPFSEERALVCINGFYGYIDESGKQVIPCQYGVNEGFESNHRFSQGLAAVRFNIGNAGIESENNFGYIDKNGNTVFEPADYYANAFSEGFAMIKDLFDYYFIDPEGQIPFERTTQAATSFSEGLADFYDTDTECYGYIDTSGEWAIKPTFKATMRFTEGLAVIKSKRGKSYGYIDRNGELLIPEQFKRALPFASGLAYVETAKHNGYINKSGEFIWQSK